MQHIRQAIADMDAAQWSDDDMLALLVNRPTPEQLAELKAETQSGDQSRPAKAMANAVRHEIDQYRNAKNGTV